MARALASFGDALLLLLATSFVGFSLARARLRSLAPGSGVGAMVGQARQKQLSFRAFWCVIAVVLFLFPGFLSDAVAVLFLLLSFWPAGHLSSRRPPIDRDRSNPKVIVVKRKDPH